MTLDLDHPSRVSALARAVRGRYPAELLRAQPEIVRLGLPSYTPPNYAPELHPLNSEWYFTETSAEWLAASLPSGRTLTLGVPTVAVKLRNGSVLVDSSPYLPERFPQLDKDDFLPAGVGSLDFRSEFDSVLLDPPWYFPEMLNWLEMAARAVRPQGQIWIPLMLEGTRPTATADRERLLSWLSQRGDVLIVEEAIEYDVPLYEERALRAAGLTHVSPWRAADLAVLTVSESIKRDESIGSSSQRAGSEWASYLVGPQVVKVRLGVGKSGGQLIEPAVGVHDFTLDTVSRRDPRIAGVDVWTSRNRVASSGDRARLREELERLAVEHSDPVRMDQALSHLLEVVH